MTGNDIMQKLTLTQPDDMHVHFRDSIYLQTTVPATANQFGRAIVMPNLKPPVTTLAMLNAYKQRILAVLPNEANFEPLMTLYLTDAITPQQMLKAATSGEVTAVKLYPAGVTTNSDAGVQDIEKLYPVFEIMQTHHLPLLVHGEVNHPEVDVFDREPYFLDTLAQLLQHFPALKIVLEHITTRASVDFVVSTPKNVAATITPHHLLLNRNHLLSGGIHPHYYCLPVLKRREDQQSLVAAATCGNPKFFLGTDSAPHAIQAKESSCGCAGIYSAHAALELYAQVFDAVGALDKLEAFASFHGADFYQLPRNTKRVTLVKKAWQIPNTLAFGQENLVPLWAGDTLNWQLQSNKE